MLCIDEIDMVILSKYVAYIAYNKLTLENIAACFKVILIIYV